MLTQSEQIQQQFNRVFRKMAALETKLDKIITKLDADNPDRLLTAAEAAPILGFRTKYPVLKLIKEGKIGARLTNHRFELSLKELQEYIHRTSDVTPKVPAI